MEEGKADAKKKRGRDRSIEENIKKYVYMMISPAPALEDVLIDNDTPFVLPFPTEETWKCLECHLTFNNRKFHKRHMRKHENPLKCTECSKTFIRREVMLKHLKEKVCVRARYHIQEVNHVCDECGKSVRWIHKHKLSHRPNAHACQLCDKTFKHKQKLLIHFETIHEGSHIRYACSNCKVSLSGPDSLRRHESTCLAT